MENNSTQEEDLKKDLEIVFAYARTHCANTRPMAEDELIGIINLKRQVFEKLFVHNNSTSDNGVEKKTVNG